MQQQDDNHAMKKLKKKSDRRLTNFPKNFFPPVSLDDFSRSEKAEYSKLTEYLKMMSVVEIKNRPSFCKDELDYNPFPLGNGKLLEVIDTLKNYLAIIKKGNETSAEFVKSYVFDMYKKDLRVFNTFYHCFFKYLRDYKKEFFIEEKDLTEQLDTAIREVVPYCSEKDIAMAFGYFLDILNWDRNCGLNGIIERVAYSYVQKSILELIYKNISEEYTEKDRLSPYICQNLMYEIAIREISIKNRDEFFYCIIYRFDELQYAFLYKDIDARVKRINDPQKMMSIILVDFIERAIVSKKLCAINNFFSTLILRMTNQFNESGNKEKISFDRYYENYIFLLKELSEIIDDNEIIDDRLFLIGFRRTLQYYEHITQQIDIIVNQLDYAYFFKKSVSFAFSDFQKKEFEKILESDKFKENSHCNYLAHNIKTNIQYLSDPDDYPSEEILQKIIFVTGKNNELIAKINNLQKKVDAKYFSVIKPYIKSLIPEDIINIVFKENDDKNNIVFSIRADRVPHLFKKYPRLLQSTANRVAIDLTIAISQDDQLEDIVAHLVNAYRTEQKKNKIYQEIVDFYQMQQEKNLIERFPLLTINKEHPDKKVEIKEASVDIGTMQSNEEILETSESQQKPKAIKRSKFLVSEKHKNSTPAYDEICKVASKKEQKQERDSRALLEAREQLGDKASQYTISLIVNSDKMKHSLVFAAKLQLKNKESGVYISPKAQEKINSLAGEGIGFVSAKGKDGLKPCSGVIAFKARNAGGQSYRSVLDEECLPSGGILYLCRSVSEKQHADKKLKAAIKRRKKR